MSIDATWKHHPGRPFEHPRWPPSCAYQCDKAFNLASRRTFSALNGWGGSLWLATPLAAPAAPARWPAAWPPHVQLRQPVQLYFPQPFAGDQTLRAAQQHAQQSGAAPDHRRPAAHRCVGAENKLGQGPVAAGLCVPYLAPAVTSYSHPGPQLHGPSSGSSLAGRKEVLPSSGLLHPRRPAREHLLCAKLNYFKQQPRVSFKHTALQIGTQLLISNAGGRRLTKWSRPCPCLLTCRCTVSRRWGKC